MARPDRVQWTLGGVSFSLIGSNCEQSLSEQEPREADGSYGHTGARFPFAATHGILFAVQQVSNSSWGRMEEQARRVDISSETVRTETLPEGAFFVSPDGVLYRVVMAERAGFRKAEPWPSLGVRRANDDRQPVALVPGSLLARNYSLVTEGRPLPVLSRTDFLHDGQPDHYFFPNESLACWAARLDEALARRSGLAARKERHYWVLSDGQHDFRFYHFQADHPSDDLVLPSRFREEQVDAQPCHQGPRYWWHLPGWKEAVQAPAPAEESQAGLEPPFEAKADVMMQAPSVFALVEKTKVELESPAEPVKVEAVTPCAGRTNRDAVRTPGRSCAGREGDRGAWTPTRRRGES